MKAEYLTCKSVSWFLDQRETVGKAKVGGKQTTNMHQVGGILFFSPPSGSRVAVWQLYTEGHRGITGP